MLDSETRRRIDTARDILVGKVPDPKSQVEQITIALIYKFMDDMDAEAEELGGKRSFFVGEYEKFSWAKLIIRNEISIVRSFLSINKNYFNSFISFSMKQCSCFFIPILG